MNAVSKPRTRRSPKGAKVTWSTLPANVRARAQLLLKESDLSVSAIYARLDLDDVGLNFGSFRGTAHKERKKTGLNLGRWRGNFSRARANTTADLVFFWLCSAFSRRFTDAVVQRLIGLAKVEDLGKDT